MKYLFCLSLLGCLVACGGGGGGTPTPLGRPGEPQVMAPGDAKIGDATRCPVSGDEFVVDVSAPKVEHQGTTYYFCSTRCQKKFEAEPAKYLPPPETSPAP